MNHTHVVTLAILIAAAAAAAAVAGGVLCGRQGRVSWWTSEGPLCLPALHPADRALVNDARDLIGGAWAS